MRQQGKLYFQLKILKAIVLKIIFFLIPSAATKRSIFDKKKSEVVVCGNLWAPLGKQFLNQIGRVFICLNSFCVRCLIFNSNS